MISLNPPKLIHQNNNETTALSIQKLYQQHCKYQKSDFFWSKNTCPSDRRKPISQKIVVRQNQDLIKFDLRQHKELHVYHRTSTST